MLDQMNPESILGQEYDEEYDYDDEYEYNETSTCAPYTWWRKISRLLVRILG